MKIFKPLIDNILQLVKDQVSCVKIKRIEDGVANALEIKVCRSKGVLNQR
jgi:hypothetical protein